MGILFYFFIIFRHFIDQTNQGNNRKIHQFENNHHSKWDCSFHLQLSRFVTLSKYCAATMFDNSCYQNKGCDEVQYNYLIIKESNASQNW